MRGDDASLVGQRAHDLLGDLAGAYDIGMVVEEHGGTGADELEVGTVVDALTTPPFLADRRIVVLRDAGRLVAADAARLVTCLADPLPGVALVLVAGSGTIPAALGQGGRAPGRGRRRRRRYRTGPDAVARGPPARRYPSSSTPGPGLDWGSTWAVT